jgi:hypothetical protein
MAARGWTGLIAGAALVLALAGCVADPNAPPPGLALTGEPLVNSSCLAVAASDPLMAQLREGETMAACPPWVIPGFTSRSENQARLIARPGRWTVYAVPPAPRRTPLRGNRSNFCDQIIIGAALAGCDPCGGIITDRDCVERYRREASAER